MHTIIFIVSYRIKMYFLSKWEAKSISHKGYTLLQEKLEIHDSRDYSTT